MTGDEFVFEYERLLRVDPAAAVDLVTEHAAEFDDAEALLDGALAAWRAVDPAGPKRWARQQEGLVRMLDEIGQAFAYDASAALGELEAWSESRLDEFHGANDASRYVMLRRLASRHKLGA